MPAEDTIVVAKPKHTAKQFEPTVKKAHQARQLQVKPSLSDFARLQSSNWAPPLPITPKHAAIAALKVCMPISFTVSLLI